MKLNRLFLIAYFILAFFSGVSYGYPLDGFIVGTIDPKIVKPKNGDVVSSQTRVIWKYGIKPDRFIINVFNSSENLIASYTTNNEYYDFKAPNYLPINASALEVVIVFDSNRRLKPQKIGRINISVSNNKLLDGEGTLSSPYQIYWPEHFEIIDKQFTYKSNEIPTKKIYFSQIDNIEYVYDTVGGITPPVQSDGTKIVDQDYISNNGRFFSGVYDGCNKKIKILSTRKQQDCIGLFNLAKNAEIKNINIAGNLHGSNYVGGIVGYGSKDCKIYDCKCTGINIYGNSFVGGIVGYLESNNAVDSCKVEAKIVSKQNYVGGIVGYLKSDCSIYNCKINGDVTSHKNYAGGIAGYLEPNCKISDCNSIDYNRNSNVILAGSYNKNEIEAKMAYVGGIAGHASSKCEFIKCSSSFSIKTKKYLGGIVGFCQDNVKFTECFSHGIITGDYLIGGLAGFCSERCIFNDCSFEGQINSYEEGKNYKLDAIGGIAGSCQNNCEFIKCVSKAKYNEKEETNFNPRRGSLNTVTITEEMSNTIGGILGSCSFFDNSGKTNIITYDMSVLLSECENHSNIKSASGHSGGIIGYAGLPIKIENCENLGDIVSDDRDYIGGIVGCYENDCFISKSENKSKNVHGNIFVGGIIGGFIGNPGKVDISECANNSEVSGNESVGGIAGSCIKGKILSTTNNGNINGRTFVGGFVGESENNAISKNCKNNASVIAQNGYAGSAFGYDDGTSKIFNLINSGKIETKKLASTFSLSIFGLGKVKEYSAEHIGLITEKNKKEKYKKEK